MIDRRLKVFVWIGLGLFATAICVYRYYFSDYDVGGPEQWGWFGDFLGGVLNPLLGFLTIILLVVSLSLQLKELNYAREEQALMRQEMAIGNNIYQSQKEMQLRSSLRDQLFNQYKEYLAIFDSDMSKDISTLDSPHENERLGVSPAKVVVQVRRQREGMNHNGEIIGFVADWDGMAPGAAMVLRGDIRKVQATAKALIHYFDSSLLTDQVISEFKIHHERVRDLALFSEFENDQLLNDLYLAVRERELLADPRFEWHTPRPAWPEN